MAQPRFPDAEKAPPLQFLLSDFQGINTRAERPAIEDQEFSWLENYLPIGKGNLRSMYSNGSPIYTAGAGLSIIYVYFFNLGAIAQAAVFLSDGTAYQVNTSTGAVVTITAGVNTFYDGGAYLPAAAQWSSSGIVITTMAQGTQGYFAWDGTTLYVPGSAAPAWLTNGTATAMPSGVYGASIEVYQSRVWIGRPPIPGTIASVLLFSGPGNGATFSGVDGGGATPVPESYLRNTITQLRQSNGFLYVSGDSSWYVISNVQITGTTTTFNFQNIEPQVGASWPGSVQSFGHAVLFANAQGVWALVGSTATKISDNLDGIFTQATFSTANPTLFPTAAVATIFGVNVYMLLVTAPDYLGTTRNYLCMFGGKKWFIGSQVSNLLRVYPQTMNSTLTAWGTDGGSLFQIFSAASSSLTKTIRSKLWAGGQMNSDYNVYKQTFRFYLMATDRSGAGAAFNGTIDTEANTSALPANFALSASQSAIINFTNSLGGIIQFVNSAGAAIYFAVRSLFITFNDVRSDGLLVGYTMTSTSPDHVITATTLLCGRRAPLGG